MHLVKTAGSRISEDIQLAIALAKNPLFHGHKAHKHLSSLCSITVLGTVLTKGISCEQ